MTFDTGLDLLISFIFGDLFKEDTHHHFHPLPFSDDNGPGPFEAVEEFDRLYPNEYVHDTERETRFGFTWNPRGYLIKQ